MIEGDSAKPPIFLDLTSDQNGSAPCSVTYSVPSGHLFQLNSDQFCCNCSELSDDNARGKRSDVYVCRGAVNNVEEDSYHNRESEGK